MAKFAVSNHHRKPSCPHGYIYFALLSTVESKSAKHLNLLFVIFNI